MRDKYLTGLFTALDHAGPCKASVVMISVMVIECLSEDRSESILDRLKADF